MHSTPFIFVYSFISPNLSFLIMIVNIENHFVCEEIGDWWLLIVFELDLDGLLVKRVHGKFVWGDYKVRGMASIEAQV